MACFRNVPDARRSWATRRWAQTVLARSCTATPERRKSFAAASPWNDFKRRQMLHNGCLFSHRIALGGRKH